jgi:hypothetical protein
VIPEEVESDWWWWMAGGRLAPSYGGFASFMSTTVHRSITHCLYNVINRVNNLVNAGSESLSSRSAREACFDPLANATTRFASPRRADVALSPP